MSAKANPTRIGIFVVGAVVLLVACLVVFGSGKFFEKANRVVTFFEGSLTGLSVGAPVTFRGVPIGSVTGIKVQYFADTLKSRIPVYIEIVESQLEIIGELPGTFDERIKKLVDKGLRAQLVSQSLVTGQLAIQLDLEPGTPVHLIGGDSSVAEIPTVPSTIQKLMSEIQKLNLEQLVNSATKLVQDVDALITTPEAKALVPDLLMLVDDARGLVSDVDKVLLADVLNLVGKAKGLVSDLDAEIKPTAASLRGATDAAKGAFDQGKSTIANLDRELSPTITEIRQLVRDVDVRVPNTMARLDAVLARADNTLDPDSPLMKDLRRTLKEFSAAAYAVRALAEELERNPSVLIRGK